MLPSAIISANAATVAEKVGKARLIGTRPAISQARQNSAMDASRHHTIWRRLRACSPGSAAICAVMGSSSLAYIRCASSRCLLRADFGKRLVQRLEGPEILDLQARGVAFDLARQGIEGEVVLGRLFAAAVVGERAGRHGFFIIR